MAITETREPSRASRPRVLSVCLVGCVALLTTLPASPAVARTGASGLSAKSALRDQARGLYVQGRTQYNLGRFRQALALFSKAYQIAPLSGFLFNIAQCHRFMGNHKRAVFFYRGYLRDNPGTPNAAAVQQMVRLCEKARASRVTKRKRANALFTEGMRLYNLNQLRPALVRLSEAYQQLPLSGYRYHIAQCHRRLKQYKPAVFYYQAYLRDNPGTPKESLVKAFITSCKKAQAEQELRRRRLLNPRLRGKDYGRKPIPIPKPRARPLYKRWWLWTVVAVAATALAVGLGAGLGLQGKDGGQTLPDTQLGTVDLRR